MTTADESNAVPVESDTSIITILSDKEGDFTPNDENLRDSSHLSENGENSVEPPTKKFKPASVASEERYSTNSRRAVKSSMDSCMQQIAEGAREVHNKWREAFKESEEFESVALMRVEALLKEANAHKKSLESEKQALIKRLKGVTNILEKSSAGE